MQALERTILDNDWITILLLGIVLLLAVVNSLEVKNFRLLIKLPYDKRYLLQDNISLLSFFNISLFIASNLILSLFFYFFLISFYPEINEKYNFIYPRILGFLLLYWGFKFILDHILFTLFESKSDLNKALFIKMSYFFSANIYLLVLLFFINYTYTFPIAFLYTALAVYSILLLIRYYHFIVFYKKFIISHFFYFILYLCALEIAPIFVAIKFGI